MTDRIWPDDLVAYKRTPPFTEATVPAGLLRAHETKPGVWARLHVTEGALRFRDLVTGVERLLSPGIHPLVFPASPHEVAPDGMVRFFVEFLRQP
ncbi:hypothetical protein DK26_27405 [Bosea sp. WAO]|uniref:DUF1971 domain-containing protein n=1 Tax=Bosea sp. WAO TaxID=406341 RepID=UPI0007494E21|nr:DUF1971 domain-containing protein [Bosea sp. WAO]KUL92740.1 hypothetical protein DK26_27405 [Bosea sp. WAO]